MTKNTGAITIIRCSCCFKETQEFPSAHQAREWAYANGWKRVRRQFFCPECSSEKIIISGKKVVYK